MTAGWDAKNSEMDIMAGPAREGPAMTVSARISCHDARRWRSFGAWAAGIRNYEIWPTLTFSKRKRGIPLWFYSFISFLFIEAFIRRAPQPDWTRALIASFWWEHVVKSVLIWPLILFVIAIFLRREGLTLGDCDVRQAWNKRVWMWGIGGGLFKYLIVNVLGLKAVLTLGAAGPASLSLVADCKSVQGAPDFLALLYAGVFVYPIIEEIIFRGYCFASFRATWGKSLWKDGLYLALSSLIFGLIHNSQTAFKPLYIAGGASYGLIFLLSGSLRASILAHAVSNGIVYVSILLLYMRNSQ